MKSILLALCLLVPSQGFAAYCSKVKGNEPCTPDPGDETDLAKQDILDIIASAQKTEAMVRKLEKAYLTIRKNPSSTDQEKLDAFEAYRGEKIAQDQLYKDALEATATLYHVRPNSQDVQIAPSKDPAIGYTKGISAPWNPQVTDSGPGVKLAIRVKGSDGRDHYSGAVSMDPAKPDGLLGITIEDGRVLILKDVFTMAAKTGNPGIIAITLYHEAQHFNRLSHTSGLSRKRHGWGSPEEEEAYAYTASAGMADVFQINGSLRDSQRQHRDRNLKRLSQGQISSRTIDPGQESLWEAYYRDQQLNLEEEYEKLQARAAVSRQAQEAIQRVQTPKSLWNSTDLKEFGRELGELKKLSFGPDIVAVRVVATTSGFNPPVLPNLKDFAVAACRNPDTAEFVNLASPDYDFKFLAADDRVAASLAAGMGDCPNRLFHRLIQLIRNREYGAIDRNWLRSTVAAYSPASGGTPGNSAPSGGSGRREPPPNSTPPPATVHDPRGEALSQLEQEEEMARRKRWGLRPVR